MQRLDLVSNSIIAAFMVLFAVGIIHSTDPALASGTLHPVDSRQGHVGALSYDESENLIERLRAQREAESNPERHAVYSAQIADVLAQKHQHILALVELDEALRLFPERPELLARAALLHFAVGQRARAQATLQEARKRAPELEVVHSAAAIIEKP